LTQYCPTIPVADFSFSRVFDDQSSRFSGGRKRRKRGLGIACSMVVAAFVTLFAAAPARAEEPASGWSQTGTASFYAKFWHGRRTASGERFDNNELTAAHPWLPFGTRVRVMAETGQEVVVTITDRMFSRRRIIDLSQAAARALGMIRAGTAEVTLVTE
jgi:rare lipoprotein A (peptidoglycan hydrolase)